MFKKLIIVIVFAAILGSLAIMFFREEKQCVAINFVTNNSGIKAYQIQMKSNNVLYMKCRFRNAGVLHNSYAKHGLSAIVGDLLCRKINELSPEETIDKLEQLGIEKLSIFAVEDDFIISFYVLKDKADAALRFLSPIFSQPEFSTNDLEFIKGKYPSLLELETAPPQGLLWDKLLSMLYQNHNYGRNNTGTAQAVASVTAEDVREFVKFHFSKNALEFFVTGDATCAEIADYADILFGKLTKRHSEKSPDKISDLSSSKVSEEKDAIISKKNMGNVVGVIVGVRVDNLSEKERAAAHIIIETLFDGKTGDFPLGLRAKNIAYDVNYHFLQRNFSNVFYFLVYIDKNDLENYKKYVENKTSSYQNELNIIDFKRTQNLLAMQSEIGFADMAEIDKRIEYNSLPFAKVTQSVLTDTARKLFNKSRQRIVYIGS
ncbi:MAG: insulinase family protein [Holosporaceae bacterium]|jgi:predicted Zn-dependent peptidase|nr:insulinase family protein [Holosporaceae bacterium]